MEATSSTACDQGLIKRVHVCWGPALSFFYCADFSYSVIYRNSLEGLCHILHNSASSFRLAFVMLMYLELWAKSENSHVLGICVLLFGIIVTLCRWKLRSETFSLADVRTCKQFWNTVSCLIWK